MVLLFLFSIVFGLFFSLVFGTIPDGFDSWVLFFIVIQHAVIFLGLRRPTSVINGIGVVFGIDKLFYLFFYFLFCFPYVSHLLGISDIYVNRFIDTLFLDDANRSIVGSTIAIVFFYLGFDFYARKRIEIFSDKKTDRGGVVFSLRVAFILQVILFLVYVGTGSFYSLFGEYTGLGAEDATADGVNFLITFFSMIIAGHFIYLTYLKRGLDIGVAGYVIPSVLWMVLLLISGDRNSFLLIALVFLVGISTYLFRVRPFFWVVMLISGFVLYQFIEVYRSTGSKDITSIVGEVFSGGEGRGGVSESSFTLTTISSRASYDEHPSGEAVFFGRFKLIGFMGVVPYSRAVLVDKGFDYFTSSEYISEVVLGGGRSWSIGSNIVSDIVLDVGVLFLPAFMLAVGLFGGRVYFNARCNYQYDSSIIYMMTAALYCEYPRYSFDFPVRAIVWAFLFFWVVSKMYSRRGKRIV